MSDYKEIKNWLIGCSLIFLTIPSHSAYYWYFQHDNWTSGGQVNVVQSIDYLEDCYNGDSAIVLYWADQDCTITHLGALFQGIQVDYFYDVRYYLNPSFDAQGYPILNDPYNPAPNPVFTYNIPGFYVMDLTDWGSNYPVPMIAGDILVIRLTNFGTPAFQQDENVELCTDNDPAGNEYHVNLLDSLVDFPNCSNSLDWSEDVGIGHDFIIRAGWEVPDSTQTPVPSSTPTNTPAPTSTFSPAPTFTTTQTPTNTFIPANTPSPSITPTSTPTNTTTPTSTSTLTPTITPTSTPANTGTFPPTITPTAPTGFPTFTQPPPTSTFSQTPTRTATATSAASPTITPPPTYTMQPTYTPYPTYTPEPSSTPTPIESSPTAAFTEEPSSTPTQPSTATPTSTPTYEPYRLPFFDDFEEVTPWTVDPHFGACFWHLETVRYFSFSHSWAYNRGDPIYDYNSDGRNSCSLISPVISLQGAQHVILTYQDWIEVENRAGFDGCFTEVSIDFGVSWVTVFTTYSPTRQWGLRGPFDLSQFSGELIQVRFRFDTVDSQFNAFEGWYLDDIKIVEETPPTPSPTPYNGNAGVRLRLNDDVFYEGSRFVLDIDYLNPGATDVSADVFIVLDIFGSYWFWPDWTQEVHSGARTMPHGAITSENIFDFIWPPFGGQFDGVLFWGAALKKNSTDLYGDYSVISFGCNL